ncbi:hypothetical protein ALP8811_03216 [Aliiroseovarius pelagivivens]|uniref:Uncharacterized protein n=1 Tax=Aliiroseovarius pelagivivens TaxID=1639690 RepID=A0A2R8AT93_9RHOB|nr:DUF5665 domain-containing protein [Aliiroseovarius pelagivivens]SPF79276.1 hypothetical protein ALP8811_03216 [Aliiroseovarius pelagivivens]
MPNSDSDATDALAQREEQLSQEVRALRAEVERMNNHRFIRLHDSLFKLGMFQLYRGLAFGLGSVLGATILVSWVIYMLGSIDFIPVLGDWATQIIDEIQIAPPQQ